MFEETDMYFEGDIDMVGSPRIFHYTDIICSCGGTD
jgi:hypothetical protein